VVVEIPAINEVDAEKMIKAIAAKLKEMMQMPDWAKFVKTGTSKERPPEQPDWWFIRSASMLRRIYIDGPVGVSRLRTYYGSRKNLGHQPSHFKKAGGKIIRTILQQLESLELIEKEKKGRKITSKGQKFLDSIAKEIS